MRVMALWAFALGITYAIAADIDNSPNGTTMDGITWNCSGWHTVVSGDTCYSIEQDYNITEAEFLEWNPAVSSDCGTNFWPDYAYCVRVGAPGSTMDGIASNCNAWHTVVSGDSCYSIEQEYNITSAEFLEWNPAVSSDCATNFWPDYSYCVGVNTEISTPTGTTATATASRTGTIVSSTSLVSTATTPINTTTTPYSTRHPITSYNLTAPYTATALPPEKTLSGQPSYCNTWHIVTPGESCNSIVLRYSNRLTSDQLLEYNPTIGEDCSGLYVGWYICVGIQAQSSSTLYWYTSGTNASIPEATEYVAPAVTVVANFTASPQQTGIPSSCQNYYQAAADDTCQTILSEYSYITEDQFFEWNPALNGDCNGLWSGYYYCVANFDASDLPMPPTITANASPTATGTVSTCEAWYLTVANDDCAVIAEFFGTFTESDFISWNPSVLSDCSNIQEDVYYCVSIPGTPTTRTAAISTTSMSSLPTQTGLTSNCTEYWLVSSSDTCASIISDSGVSSDNFYSWNPAVGSDCSALSPDYYVCVSTDVTTTSSRSTVTITPGSSGTTTVQAITTTSSQVSQGSITSAATTTTGSGTVTTPSPFMPGMVDGCVRFYFRGEDAADLYCYDLAADAGIALDDFYTWNPQVGTDCTNLWADTWYCIGISGPATTISTGLPSPAAT